MGEAEKTERGISQVWRVFDVGNTHIKSGNFIDGRLGRIFIRRSSKTFQSAPSLSPDGALAAVASVNPAALVGVLDYIRGVGSKLSVVLESDGSIFKNGLVTADVKSPETTGVDRVLACLGALLEAPDRTVIVVDCGTATTVNVMTADRCFRGGMIAPGRRLLAKALFEGTASLPLADVISPEPAIGRSTSESLNAGIAAAMIGGIRECVDVVRREHPDAAVFLTGGDLEFAAKSFPAFRRLENLTLHGLHWYAVQTVGALK
jgi:type III pantothenate kinase